MLLFLVSILFAGLSAFAMNGRTTYQAKIAKPDGYPLEAASVNFRFTVLDTVGACILYVEDYAAINMQDTGGLVSFALGNGTRSFPTSGTAMTFQHIFDNSVASFACQNAGVYLPGPTDTRKIVMQFNEGLGWQTLPAMAINSVPYAMYANESNNTKALNGKADTAFVENATLAALNCQSNEALRFNGASFSCVNISVSATAVVNALGYAPVQSVSATAPLISSGGSTPSLSITQATSTTNGYLSSVDWNTFNGKLNSSQAAIIAALGYTPADSAVSGTYLVKANNLSDLVNVATARSNLGLGSFATASSLDLGSASATGTIADARLANQAGVTSGTQYTKVTVDGKGRVTSGANLSASDVTTALGFTPADNSVSGTYAQRANNLSDLSNVATARSNLGLGTFATASSLDLGSASATGTIADARLANQSGVTSGTQYTKVTVDGKGRVTSGASLSATDVTNALGFTPADNSVSGTYAQRANNLSDLSNVATARTNLGLGTLATASSLDLGSASATGTIADARLANQSGVTSGTQYTKVTVDGKGRVTNGSSLASGDVTTALGYTPAQASSATQWTTNGTAIGYTVGKVGIGTTSPSSLLEVKQTSATIKVTSTDGTSPALFTANLNGILKSIFGTEGIAGTTFTNSLTFATIFGSDSSTPLQLATNNSVRATILANGNMGVGTVTPAAKLDVAGQVKTSMGTPLVNPAGNAVDFATGNTQYVTFSTCAGNALTVNLYSMFEGSSYSIVVVAPNGCVVDFTGTTDYNGGSGGTAVTAFKYPAGQKFSSTGNPMVYSFLRANNFVFVAQVVDFQ